VSRRTGEEETGEEKEETGEEKEEAAVDIFVCLAQLFQLSILIEHCFILCAFKYVLSR
jgi:hypothetical protein